ncbi:MAG TPA: hypothetical protein PLC32_01625 [Candidatus Omnitrophota bacterium]|nr:hypothetical protein [Candidatus Omnitrophota bacterium]
MLSKIALFFSFLVLLSSCSIITRTNQMLTLKSLGDDQALQTKFLKQQEKNFQLLLSDVQNGILKKGATRKDMLSRYGEPIAIKEMTKDSLFAEQFVYRHPEQFFDSEKVYLFFDKDQALAEWKYEPAPEK